MTTEELMNVTEIELINLKDPSEFVNRDLPADLDGEVL